MQEEVTRGAVTLIVDGAKLSEQVFEKAVKKFLEEIQKSQKPKIYRGRQSLKQLSSQNAGLANIEISDKNIKAFSRVAKKYHVDFALKKDTAAEQPRYLVFFKSRDADAITAAFQEFASRKMSREDKKSHYVSEDNWTVFENTQEAIIDQETFDNVQRIRSNVRRYPDGWGEAHPLTGLMYCADCGSKMYVHRVNNGKRVPQYTCSAYTCCFFRIDVFWYDCTNKRCLGYLCR